MFTKLASANLNEYLVKTAGMLRSQQAEITDLRQQLASHERKGHAEKIAALAVERGVIADDDESSYAEKLASSDDNLALVEEFVGRKTSALGLGKPLEKIASAEGESGELDCLTTYLLGSDLAR